MEAAKVTQEHRGMRVKAGYHLARPPVVVDVMV